jgi:hypothetical protein
MSKGNMELYVLDCLTVLDISADSLAIERWLSMQIYAISNFSIRCKQLVEYLPVCLQPSS